jgi:hypothetical protein
LLNHGEAWQQLATHERLLPVIRAVLGSDALLNTYGTSIIGPGESAQPIHVDDSPFIGARNASPLRHRPRLPETGGRQPIVLNTMVALCDFTEVRKRLLCAILYQNPKVNQDRLGTNTRKTQKKGPFMAGARRHPHRAGFEPAGLPARGRLGRLDETERPRSHAPRLHSVFRGAVLPRGGRKHHRRPETHRCQRGLLRRLSPHARELHALDPAGACRGAYGRTPKSGLTDPHHDSMELNDQKGRGHAQTEWGKSKPK